MNKLQPTELDLAIQRLRETKTNLEAAKSIHDVALHAFLSLLGKDDIAEEGTTKIETDYFKVGVTAKINRTVDQKILLESVKPKMRPGAFKQIFNEKYSVSKAGMDNLQHAEPDQYQIAAEAITAKPSKPYIAKIEVL